MEAEAMAKNLFLQKKLAFENKVQWIYIRAFARAARTDEVTAAKELIARLAKLSGVKQNPESDFNTWKNYIHSVFNLKEFIYLM